MSVTRQTMTDEQRTSVALEYLKRLDRGENIFDLLSGVVVFMGLTAHDAQTIKTSTSEALANGDDGVVGQGESPGGLEPLFGLPEPGPLHPELPGC